MRRTSLFSFFLSLLLIVLVGGEATDLLPCGEEECSGWIELFEGDEATPVPTDPGADEPGSDRSGDCCLCHLSFAPSTAPVGVALFHVSASSAHEPADFPETAEFAVPSPPPRA